jgi:hypothetical protein
MIKTVLIKQEQVQGKNFYMHVKGDCIAYENYSKFAFEAFTTQDIHNAVSEIIKEMGLTKKYTIGVTTSNKIQITLNLGAENV